MRKLYGQLLGKSARFQQHQLTSEINPDIRRSSLDNGATSRCGISTSGFRNESPVNTDRIVIVATEILCITFHQTPTNASNPRCVSRSTEHCTSSAICPAYNTNNLVMASFSGADLKRGGFLKSIYACTFYLSLAGSLMCLSLSCLLLVLTLNPKLSSSRKFFRDVVT